MEAPPRNFRRRFVTALLKLKRVEIHGFKSFCDRTEMKFHGAGIAAVVGPNGCGKSNLSDAISWVLGEQSAKSLRGARMEDVIFAGTRDRKPLGMASVTMTLVPDEAAFASANLALPAPAAESPAENSPSEDTRRADATPAARTAQKHGEITITRRLYRSGESEYLINGKLARLRDIQDLFLGTGLGPESYAIIEQGRIGQILSNRPQDRRAVIEEAAGITKFKTRKRLAEAKLESAKQNLSRVFDILEEVSRQVNSLKRQAAKTKRYAELKSEGAGYLRRLLSAKSKVLEREAARVAIELSMATAELERAQQEVAAREQEQASLVETSYATESALTEARNHLAGLQLEAERARGRMEYQLRQIQQIDERVEKGIREAQAIELQEQERSRELEEQTGALEALNRDCAASRSALEERTRLRQAAQARLSEQEQGLEAARQRVLKLMNEASGLRNRVTQLEAQLATAGRDAERARAEEVQSEADLKRVRDLKTDISERLAARQTELISLGDQRQEIERELQEKRALLAHNRQALERLRAHCSRIKARRDSLDDVIRHRSYTTETVKQLFAAIERGKAELAPVGVLADFLEVDPQLEKAAEEFLHDELEYVVVRDWAAAERGIEIMRRDLNGRVTFLVEESGAPATTDLPRPDPRASGLTPLAEKLRLTNGLSQIPLAALPRLANCYIAPACEVAQKLAAEYPGCWFLLPDGSSYHGQAVSGGKKTGAGPLALKRELRELAQSQRTAEAELNQVQSAGAALEHEIAALAENLERIRAQQQLQEKDVLAMDHESRKLAEEFQRVQSRLSKARLELERIGRDRQSLESNLERDRAALSQSERLRAEQEAQLEKARGELQAFQAEVARSAEEHAALRAALASLEERQRSAAAHRSRLEAQIREFSGRRSHLLRETERLTTERAALVESNAGLERRNADLQQAIGSLTATVNELASREAALRQSLAAAEEQLKALRARGQAAQERRAGLQVALARAESDRAHLEETCRKELATSLAELAAADETLPEEAELASIEAKYDEVRRKIEALGPVNPQALEEFEEAQHRQDFLNAQRQDLLDSIRDTEKAIREIDGESRKRFSDAFHAINAHFRERFKILFGGGTAEMRLTDEDNAAESGIDIIASPPGKRLQSVLLLSGGEKSLTAMALLMAIFEYTPSPFCILDEVDAPLDEPNIERLTKLLREMAERTQFIVITHSKRTMEAAQALYGVTMQEPGVSRLVSVKFKEPEPAPVKTMAAAATEAEQELEPAIV
jgi:chromosome segregation protein